MTTLHAPLTALLAEIVVQYAAMLQMNVDLYKASDNDEVKKELAAVLRRQVRLVKTLQVALGDNVGRFNSTGQRFIDRIDTATQDERLNHDYDDEFLEALDSRLNKAAGIETVDNFLNMADVFKEVSELLNIKPSDDLD